MFALLPSLLSAPDPSSGLKEQETVEKPQTDSEPGAGPRLAGGRGALLHPRRAAILQARQEVLRSLRAGGRLHRPSDEAALRRGRGVQDDPEDAQRHRGRLPDHEARECSTPVKVFFFHLPMKSFLKKINNYLLAIFTKRARKGSDADCP